MCCRVATYKTILDRQLLDQTTDTNGRPPEYPARPVAPPHDQPASATRYLRCLALSTMAIFLLPSLLSVLFVVLLGMVSPVGTFNPAASAKGHQTILSVGNLETATGLVRVNNFG